MRGRTGRSLPAALAGLLGAVLIVGCSGDEPEAGRLTPTPTSSSPTSIDPSPTPTTPEQQVEAAVRTYYAELTRAAQTEDISRTSTTSDLGAAPVNGHRGMSNEKPAQGGESR